MEDQTFHDIKGSTMIETELKKILLVILAEDSDLAITIEKSNYNQPLVNFGLQSIKYIKLIVRIEERFGFEMEEEGLEFNRSITFHDLESIIQKHTGAK